ncbi:hypothetical protein AVEN_152011-1 [Araneus ventricosus]|uniref:Gustatory receptor n=1 Tax=Araneus ventricosus TaxID=182803 RepID=A0A4Y2LZW5_ARAVE|nr:hypothetical protein AVEN_79446-1 [Araneus ventricosus]GBN18977.1 hypothetical protein AVEN_152011-1 [Araneus ventricosus]
MIFIYEGEVNHFEMKTAVINVADVFKKQFGMLWTVLEYTGIHPCEQIHQKRCRNVRMIIRGLFFPFFLLCNLSYCWYITISHGAMSYTTFLDSVIPFLTPVLWLVLYLQRNSLKSLIGKIARTTTTLSISQNRRLTFSVNAGLFLTFFSPVFLMLMRVASRLQIRGIDFFRYLQELIFPSIVTILYTSLCYILLQNLRSCKDMIHTKLDISCSMTVTKLKSIYLEVVKEIKAFEAIFSIAAFIITLKNFCIVSYIVMDAINDTEWISNLLLEGTSYLALNFVSTGVLTIFASDIPSEMLSIQSTLLDRLSEQSHEDGILSNEKQILFLLKRDVCVLTAWKLFSFDRGFLLKAVVTIVVHVMAFNQLTSSITTTGNCTLGNDIRQ